MTAVVRTEPRPSAITIASASDLTDFLMERRSEFGAIAKASGIEPEALVLELVGMTRKNPDILGCTTDSIMSFMFDVAKTGLLIGRGCFAVPMKDHGTLKLEFWIGAHGMRELAIFSRSCRDVFAEVVYEDDEFEEVLGLYPDLKHRRGSGDRDPRKLKYVYGVAVFSQTHRRHVLLNRVQIERLRKLNRGDTTSPKSPWVKDTEGMWKAKAVLAIARTLPRNPRMAHAFAVVARNEGISESDLDRANEVRADPAAAAAAATEAAAPAAAFEIDEPAVVTLPNWRGHPLAGKTLETVGTDDLEALYSTLTESAPEKYGELLSHISLELDGRREQRA